MLATAYIDLKAVIFVFYLIVKGNIFNKLIISTLSNHLELCLKLSQVIQVVKLKDGILIENGGISSFGLVD